MDKIGYMKFLTMQQNKLLKIVLQHTKDSLIRKLKNLDLKVKENLN